MIAMRKYLFSLFLMFVVSFTFAQEEKNTEQAPPLNWQDRVFFGGNFALQFGNITVIDVSPLAGYRLNEKLQVGAGITYQYFSRDYGSFKVSNSIYGGRLFGRHFVAPTLFAHAEYESINLAYWDFSQSSLGEMRRTWLPAFMLGAGYAVPMGARTALNMTVLYNFLWDSQRSPTASPWVVRMGFTL